MFTLTTPRIGDILLEAGMISVEQLTEAVEIQSLTQVRLGSILIANNWVTEEQITQALSIQLEMPYADLTAIALDPNAIRLVPNEIAKRYHLLPLSLHENEDDGRPVVRLAMVNPWDIEAIDLVQRISWHRVEPVLASKSAMTDALEQAFQLAEESQSALNQRLGQGETKAMLQQMLERSLQQAQQNIAELQAMQQYLNSI